MQKVVSELQVDRLERLSELAGWPGSAKRPISGLRCSLLGFLMIPTATASAQSNELVVDVPGESAEHLRAANSEFLEEVSGSALRSRIVWLRTELLEVPGIAIQISVFADAVFVVEAERILSNHEAGVVSWFGDVVKPAVPESVRRALEEKLPPEVLERLDEMTHSVSFVIESSESVKGVIDPPTPGTQFVIRPLPNNPLFHVIYEVEPEV